MRSSNPYTKESIYEKSFALTERPMTLVGTTNKLLLLSALMLFAAALVYYQFSLGRLDIVNMASIIGVCIGFVVAIILGFKPDATPYLSPIYAISQGAAMSALSCYAEAAYPGIVIQAISLTMLTVFVMAILFSAGVIKATERFKSIIFAASATIFVFYLISFILLVCKINVPYFSVNNPLTIGLNVVIAIIAACWLIIDFDFIQKGVERGVPSFFEWYGAFSLLVTVVWLYVEILRLLSRLRNK